MPDHAAAINGYHAHIYYDSTTKYVAANVREGLATTFPDAILGSWHDNPVGPHPMGSYLIAFPPEQFADVVQWLTLNRRELTALVHPETDNDLADHTDHALWMGGVLELDVSAFKGDD